MKLSQEKLTEIKNKYNEIKQPSKKYRKQMSKIAEIENWNDYKIPQMILRDKNNLLEGD